MSKYLEGPQSFKATHTLTQFDDDSEQAASTESDRDRKNEMHSFLSISFSHSFSLSPTQPGKSGPGPIVVASLFLEQQLLPTYLLSQ